MPLTITRFPLTSATCLAGGQPHVPYRRRPPAVIVDASETKKLCMCELHGAPSLKPSITQCCSIPLAYASLMPQALFACSCSCTSGRRTLRAERWRTVEFRALAVVLRTMPFHTQEIA